MTQVTYAETILMNKKTNQWFIQFFRNSDRAFDQQTIDQHFQWFYANLLSITEVSSIGASLTNTGFYHVNFQGLEDPRLGMYQSLFEDNTGASLNPTVYQMYEWDYNNWVERGGPLEFDEFMRNNPA
jgi:hypothetical protein